MRPGIRDVSRQAVAVDVLVLERDPVITRGCLIGKGLYLLEARIRRSHRNIIEAGVQGRGKIRIPAEILVGSEVRDHQIVSMIAGIGDNHGIGWGQLLL